MPPTPSSAGWNTSFTVPASCGASSFSTAATPSSVVVWMSWPHACISPGLVLANGRPGLFLDRQRVHVGADRQHRARPAALDQPDHAGLAHARLVADAQPRQLARHHAGGAHLLEPKLRMRVDVATDLDQRCLDALGGVADRGGRIVGKRHRSAPGRLLGGDGTDEKTVVPHPCLFVHEELVVTRRVVDGLDVGACEASIACSDGQYETTSNST